MKSLYLNKNISNRVENGHPWIFENEINRGKALDAAAKAGEIVNVFTHDKKFIGKGYVNPQSQIMVRLLTRNQEEIINEAFFYKKIAQAWAYRQALGYTENCRLIFGEADDLPQLIIDKFNDYFVIQTLALGIDIWKPAIVSAIEKLFSPKGIYERNDVPVRELEGMVQHKGFLSAEFDTNIIINENGIKLNVDIVNGQKTGYFLDQQDNRRAIQHIVKGADVLGAFCYTGSFEISAAHYGAKSVLGIDISQAAIDACNKNAALNGLGSICKFECVNAFDVLKEWTKEGKQWDVVMLDPPSFTKNRSTIDKAGTVATFVAQGAHVSFFDIDAEDGAAVAEQLGPAARFAAVDVTDTAALQSAIAAEIDHGGAFDVLVNNAASDDRHGITEITDAYWDKRLAVNLKHSFSARRR